MQRVVVQGGDWSLLVSIFIRYLCNRGTLKLTLKISRHMTELYEHRQGPPKLVSHPCQYLIHLFKSYSAREKVELAEAA